MSGQPFFWLTSASLLDMEAPPVPALCTYALPVCGKTHSFKSYPEFRVFRLEWSVFVHNIHLLGGTQRVHAQGS
jgi:hypothetical protein